MESEVEALQFEVESLLYKATEEQLIKITEIIELQEDLSGKSKRQKVVIRKNIESKIDSKLADKAVLLKSVIATINDTPPPLGETNADNADPTQELLNALQKQQEELRKKQEHEINKLLSKLDEFKKTSGSEASEKQPAANNNTKNQVDSATITAHSLLRRWLTIAGQIGEPGQTDKLSFVSLTHQIDSGLKREYQEPEIVDAVIRAISPHSSFRSYVETSNDLSLAKLRKIIHVHYREKSLSELYHQLTTTFQEAKESPQQFLMRALDLRNKVTFASLEADCDFNYGPQLIQKTFLKSFETGLRDDILTTNLRPTLRTPDLTDEELMKQVNELASHQLERRNKLTTERQKAAKINACATTDDLENGKDRKAVLDKGDATSQLLAELKVMRSELNDLKLHANSAHTARPDPPRGRGRGRGGHNSQRREWGCQNCKQQGQASSCRHCFACGAGDHLAYNCNKTPQNQGNDLRLPRGDRQ